MNEMRRTGWLVRYSEVEVITRVDEVAIRPSEKEGNWYVSRCTGVFGEEESLYLDKIAAYKKAIDIMRGKLKSVQETIDRLSHEIYS